MIANNVLEDQIESLISIFIENFSYVSKNIRFTSTSTVNNSAETTIFDLSCDFCLGGVEQWSYNLAKEFISNGKKVLLLSNNSKYMPPHGLQSVAVKSTVENFGDFKLESIQTLVSDIENFMPCIIFAAHISYIMVTSLILKKNYPNKIKIVFVIHGGLAYLIEDNTLLSAYVDFIFCVSNDSYKKLLENTKGCSSKILFKETPVKLPDLTKKLHSG